MKLTTPIVTVTPSAGFPAAETRATGFGGAGGRPEARASAQPVAAGTGRLLQGQHQVRCHQEHRPSRGQAPAISGGS